jgi:hypothetical protein
MGMPPIEIDVRPLTPEDRSACDSFDCGPEPYQQQVARFVKELLWSGRPKGEETVAAFVRGSGELFGFGSWKHVQIQLADSESPQDGIRIPYFGVDQRFQGSRNAEGESVADVLYASLEQRALSHPQSTEGVPFELFCDEANIRGQHFWSRNGYEDVGPAYHGDKRYRRMVRRTT